MNKILLLASVVLASGCQSIDSAESSRTPSGLTMCTEPRPQICTREYRPVCAWIPESGSWNSYSTGCVACSDQKVAGYKDGACRN